METNVKHLWSTKEKIAWKQRFSVINNFTTKESAMFVKRIQCPIMLYTKIFVSLNKKLFLIMANLS